LAGQKGLNIEEDLWARDAQGASTRDVTLDVLNGRQQES
jgi:hypothetical protein